MVQRTAARWTCRRWHNTSHVGEMIDDLQWSTLEKRRTNSSLTLFYKIHNKLVDIDRDRYLTTNKSTRHSGRLSNSQQYDRQTSSSDLLKFSYFPRIIPLWNALPESTVAITGLFLSILGKRPQTNWEILRREICKFGKKSNRFKSYFGKNVVKNKLFILYALIYQTNTYR